MLMSFGAAHRAPRLKTFPEAQVVSQFSPLKTILSIWIIATLAGLTAAAWYVTY